MSSKTKNTNTKPTSSTSTSSTSTSPTKHKNNTNSNNNNDNDTENDSSDTDTPVDTPSSTSSSSSSFSMSQLQQLTFMFSELMKTQITQLKHELELPTLVKTESVYNTTNDNHNNTDTSMSKQLHNNTYTHSTTSSKSSSMPSASSTSTPTTTYVSPSPSSSSSSRSPYQSKISLVTDIQKLVDPVTTSTFHTFKDSFINRISFFTLKLYLTHTFEQVCDILQIKHPDHSMNIIQGFVQDQSTNICSALRTALGHHWYAIYDTMTATHTNYNTNITGTGTGLDLQDNVYLVWSAVLKRYESYTKYHTTAWLLSI